MVGIFKANNPINHFILFIYGLALKLPAFLDPVVPVPQEMDGFLYRLLLRWLSEPGESFPLIYPLIAYLLVYLQAVSLNTLVNKHKLMQRPSYLTGMAYLLITSLFSEWELLSSPVIVNTLMIWVLGQMCTIHNSNKPKTILFNIGMAIGVASFFYFPTVVFYLLVMLGLFLTRPFRLPEWLVVLLGGVTPYYFFVSWIYLTGRWNTFELPVIHVSRPYFFQSTWSYLAIALILLTVIVGIYFVQTNLRRQLVHTRKNWTMILVYMPVAFFVPFININDRLDYWVLVAVPAAVISSAGFLYPTKKLFPVSMHWAMVCLVVLTGYFLP